MRSGSKIIRLTRTEPINERRKRLEAVQPVWEFPQAGQVALAVLLAVSLFLTTAFTLNPYTEAQAEAMELPPIRDV